jgi:hypothetical protein
MAPTRAADKLPDAPLISNSRLCDISSFCVSKIAVRIP